MYITLNQAINQSVNVCFIVALFILSFILFEKRGDIQRMLLAADQRRVRYVPLDAVEALERECKVATGLQPEIQGGLAFIYPGTKW